MFKHILLCILIICSFVGFKTNAQTSSYEELQAAYLYNFAKYITWPGPCPVFTIGIMGESEIIDNLQKVLKEKKIRGVGIEVKRMETVESGMACQIIYLPSSSSHLLPSLLQKIDGKNILIVTEDDLAKKGAMISFVVDDEKLKFKINQKMLLKAGLQASEGLLKLGIVL